MAECNIQPLSLLEKNIMFKKSYILFFFTTCSSTIFSNDLYPLAYHNKTNEAVTVTVAYKLPGFNLTKKTFSLCSQTCVRFFHHPEELALFITGYSQTQNPLKRYIQVSSSTQTKVIVQDLLPADILPIRTLTITHLSKGEQIGCKVTLE